MRHVPYIPAYDMPPHGFSSPAETSCTCPLCGEDIVWWLEEEIGWNENGKMCHAECIDERNLVDVP